MRTRAYVQRRPCVDTGCRRQRGEESVEHGAAPAEGQLEGAMRNARATLLRRPPAAVFAQFHSFAVRFIISVDANAVLLIKAIQNIADKISLKFTIVC